MHSYATVCAKSPDLHFEPMLMLVQLFQVCIYNLCPHLFTGWTVITFSLVRVIS